MWVCSSPTSLQSCLSSHAHLLLATAARSAGTAAPQRRLGPAQRDYFHPHSASNMQFRADRKSAALASVFLGVKSDCGLRASSLSGGRCLRTGCTKPQDTDRRADSGITPLKSQQESVDLPLPELGEITDGGSCRIKLLSWIKLPPWHRVLLEVVMKSAIKWIPANLIQHVWLFRYRGISGIAGHC